MLSAAPVVRGAQRLKPLAGMLLAMLIGTVCIADAEPTRPITLDDMISLREVLEPRQSPDGKSVAYLVKQAFRDCDCYRTALYVVGTSVGAQPRKILEEATLSNIAWTPDGARISYLSAKNRSIQVWTIDPKTRETANLFTHSPSTDKTFTRTASVMGSIPTGVLDYQWAPNGRWLAFTAQPNVDPKIHADAERNGFRYDDETMLSLDIVMGDWGSTSRTMELWQFDVEQRVTQLLWRTAPSSFARISSMAWAPDSAQIALTVGEGRLFDAIALIDAKTGKVKHLSSFNATVTSMSWSPRGEALAVMSKSPAGNHSTLTIVEIDRAERSEISKRILAADPAWLAWEADGSRVVFEASGMGQARGNTGLYATSVRGDEPARVTDQAAKISICDVPRRGKVACVSQSPMRPPAPALVSLDRGKAIALADVSPEFRHVQLNSVQELRWTNEHGAETNGYLILPNTADPSSRVPLVIMAYGFDGDFVAQAKPSLSSYPAQAFVRDGIAVLLFNAPVVEDWEGADFARGSVAWGSSPLSSLRTIIKELSAKGVIDPSRIGFMGHSWGGFLVQYAITQSDLFRAVELHNGGSSTEPGTYWFYGNTSVREIQEHFMGGPPYGSTLKNYLSFSASLNADKIRAPVLIQDDALSAPSSMEFYTALRRNGVPVEFLVYPNESHVFTQPAHRFVSMRRNLDWFEFWLLGKENDHELSEEQYKRWLGLREKAGG